MRRATLLLLTSLPLFALAMLGESTAQGTRELISVTGFHWKLTWSVPEARLQDTGAWNTRRDPELSPSRAIEIARSYLRSQGRTGELPVTYVALHRPVKQDIPISLWFYWIGFADRTPTDEADQDPRVVVLLDGSVVTPVLTKP